VVIAVLAAGGAGGYFYHEHRQTQSKLRESQAQNLAIQLRPSVAVLGFRNVSGRPELAWLSTAMAEMLGTELSAGRRLRLVAGENVARTKRELPLSDSDTLAADTLEHLRRNLDADYVVLGSYVDLGKPGQGRIRLDLRLQDARSGEIVAEDAVNGREDDLFELITQAGMHLRERLGAGQLSSEQSATIRAALPADPEAARLYAEGLAKLRSYEHLAAHDLLQEAVKLEPSHSLAHSALAAAWKALGYETKAKAEAQRAFELAPGLERENQLWIEGLYRETTAEWDRAIEVYRSLVEFFPDDVEYALKLAETQSTSGKGKDALATVARLRQLPAPISDDPRIDIQEAYAANQLSEYKQVLSAASSAARKSEERGAKLLLARAKLLQSTAARNLDDLDGAKALDEDAQRIYEGVGDRYGAARARIRVADILWRRGEIARSNEISEECAQVFRSLGVKRDYADAIDDIAGGLIQLAQLENAKRMYEQALAVQREIGNKRGIAQELNNIGVILEQQGNLPEALKVDEQTREAYAAVDDNDGVASAVNNIGEIYFTQGDLGKAESFYRQSLALRQNLANESDVAESLHNIAELEGYRGKTVDAQRDYDTALAIRLRRGEDGAIAESRLSNAQMLLADGKVSEADTLARAAVLQFHKENETAQEASARATLAEVLLQRGKPEEAAAEIAIAVKLETKDTHQDVRFKTATVEAEVMAETNPQNSAKLLESIVKECDRSGWYVRKLEATFALGEVEIKSGKNSAGRARLQQLKNDAESRGFGLIAKRISTIYTGG
jgi:tetratricopeptide (TPR) repeat protein